MSSSAGKPIKLPFLSILGLFLYYQMLYVYPVLLLHHYMSFFFLVNLKTIKFFIILHKHLWHDLIFHNSHESSHSAGPQDSQLANHLAGRSASRQPASSPTSLPDIQPAVSRQPASSPASQLDIQPAASYLAPRTLSQPPATLLLPDPDRARLQPKNQRQLYGTTLTLSDF